MRIPISVKLILITVVLLLVVTIPIAIVSSNYFEKVSRQREENINLDFAAAKATEIENILNSLLDRAKLLSADAMNAYKVGETAWPQFEAEFRNQKNFYAFELYQVSGAQTQSLKKLTQKEVLEQKYKLQPENYFYFKARQNFPLSSVIKGQLEVQNMSFKQGPALMSIGFPVAKNEDGLITHFAVVDINLAQIQKPFSEAKERTFYVLDRRGVLLAHSDEQLALEKQDFSLSEIYSLATKSKTPKGQRPIKKNQQPDRIYSAFSKTSFGVTVFSEISESIILEPAKEVRRKAFFIAGMVLSGALFVIFLFSLSLSSPLETLVELIAQVSKGNFDVQASKKVKTLFKDEVTQLAFAFDQMTDGLKERDKVKSLFSKFHGSSVTDDLLQGQVGLGGQRKEVLVFFSDIRGFTAFSEKRSPEEVVEMLNEYFGVMVGVINKHGGVVDKFIGDAIMAIWGAPKSSEKDAQNAVRACLEMRRSLEELNKKRMAQEKPPLMIGMGLHAGPAISGTIGSDERMEYTVIGNTVNTASRIEASTKAFGTDLLVTDDVITRVADAFKVEYAGAAEVKGRSEALKMYKVRGYKDEQSGEYVDIVTPYSDYEAEGADKVKIKDVA